MAAYLGTTILAAFAFLQYRRSKQVERSKWMLQLYEKFYEEPRFKRMRDILDCDEDGEAAIERVVDRDIDALFGYYLDCLNARTLVRTYVHDASRGFEYLSLALKKRKNPRS